MALTKVTSGVRTLGTGEVATANMAVDPTNASNLSSGSVPAAQLGNVDTSGLRNDISTLALHSAIADNKAAFNLTNSFIDQYEDDTGIDNETNVDRNAAGEYMSSITTATETYYVNINGFTVCIICYVVRTFKLTPRNKCTGTSVKNKRCSSAHNLKKVDFVNIGGASRSPRKFRIIYFNVAFNYNY